jgi:hypothetical protein
VSSVFRYVKWSKLRVIGASGHPILGILMMGIKTTIKE